MIYYCDEDFPLSHLKCKKIFEEIANDEKVIDEYDISIMLELITQAKDFSQDYSRIISKIKTKCYKYFTGIDSKVAMGKLEQYTLNKDYSIGDIYKRGILKFGLVKRLTDNEIIEGLNNKFFSIHDFLKDKSLFYEKYALLHDYILKTNIGARLLVIKYDYTENNDYFFPKYSNLEVDKMILTYLENEDCNLNILNALKFHKNSEGTYFISPVLKIKIKSKIEEITKKYFEAGKNNESHIRVSIDEQISEFSGIEIKSSYPNDDIRISKKWIDKNLDNSTILNNLIYVIQLCDSKMRISNLSYKNDLSPLMRLTQTEYKNTYGDNMIFKYKQNISFMMFAVYYDYLTSIDIQLEDVIIWFFKEYVPKEFQIEGFKIKLSKSIDFFDRCNCIFSQIENILKQFSLLIDYKKIDNELFSNSSYPFKFDLYKSLVYNKYLEINNEKHNADILRIMGLLFSDQSFLTYIDEGKNESNFVRLITKHEICIDDYNSDFRKEQIKYLLEKSVVKIENGKLIFCNMAEIIILKDLYEHNFLVYNHLSDEEKDAIQKYVINGDLVFNNSLFSKDESMYLSYYLNNESFTNGLALRNKYSHASEYDSENIQHINKTDYIHGLRILCCIVIKINDELSTYYDSIHQKRLQR